MDRAQVISVNPSVKTRGELLGNSECLERISRSFSAPGLNHVSFFRKCVDFFSGVNGKVGRGVSSKLLLTRWLCSALMISSVLVPMSPDEILAFDFDLPRILTLAMGLLLIPGLFTRLATAAAAGFSGYMFVLSLVSFQPDFTMGALFLIMSALSLLGPGIYSLDQLIRLGCLSIHRKAVIRGRRVKHRAISYRAFAEA